MKNNKKPKLECLMHKLDRLVLHKSRVLALYNFRRTLGEFKLESELEILCLMGFRIELGCLNIHKRPVLVHLGLG